jgi:hypothetical protein
MVLFGIKFVDVHESLEIFAQMIRKNSEKQVAQVMFNVQAWIVESDILVVHKEFIPETTIRIMFFIMLLGSAIPMIFWGWIAPLFVVAVLMILFSLLNTAYFNFLMFKIMIRKTGYKGSLRLL